jgi:hypothetical protein
VIERYTKQGAGGRAALAIPHNIEDHIEVQAVGGSFEDRKLGKFEGRSKNPVLRRSQKVKKRRDIKLSKSQIDFSTGGPTTVNSLNMTKA